MKRFFTILAYLVGLWVIASFVGVMFDPPRAQIWTQSLMWAILSLMMMAPLFLFVGTSPSNSTESSGSAGGSPEAEQDFGLGDNAAVHEPSSPEGEAPSQ